MRGRGVSIGVSHDVVLAEDRATSRSRTDLRSSRAEFVPAAKGFAECSEDRKRVGAPPLHGTAAPVGPVLGIDPFY